MSHVMDSASFDIKAFGTRLEKVQDLLVVWCAGFNGVDDRE